MVDETLAEIGRSCNVSGWTTARLASCALQLLVTRRLRMPVSPVSVVEGRCYARFSELRRVTRIKPDGSVEYESRMKTESGGEAVSITTTTKEKFAQEVDRGPVAEVVGNWLA